MCPLSGDGTPRYAFDAEPTDHLLPPGAVGTIVADGTATAGGALVTKIDALPGDENTLHAHSSSELFHALDGGMTLYVDRRAHRPAPARIPRRR